MNKKDNKNISELYKYIGKRIRTIRNKNNLNQDDLAEKLNVTRQHISKIENAKSGMSLNKLIDICNALNCTPNDLLYEYINKLMSSETKKHPYNNLSNENKKHIDAMIKAFVFKQNHSK